MDSNDFLQLLFYKTFFAKKIHHLVVAGSVCVRNEDGNLDLRTQLKVVMFVYVSTICPPKHKYTWYSLFVEKSRK